MIHLQEMPIGTKGYIVGYDKAFQGYRGKLSRKGLTPGIEFILIRHADILQPLQIEVNGQLISLSSPEVNALCVEEITQD